MFDLKAIYDEIPNVDELKPFDGFFIGEGSAKVMSRSPVKNYYDQLYSKTDSVHYEDITDWEDFDGDFVKVEDYEELFYVAKKRVYDLVDFTSKKLSESKSKFVLVKDLVVTKLDKSFIEFFRYSIDDYATVYTLAELSAYREMGYTCVRFRAKDNCPICNAMDKSVLEIQSVMDTLVQGNSITHKYCDCMFEPFGKYYEIRDIVEDGIEEIGCPIEFKKEIISKAKELGYEFVVFGDAGRYMKYDKAEFNSDTLAFQLEKHKKKGIFIDRSFIGFDNALDYLDAARFNRYAEILSAEGINYVDPKDLKGELYVQKKDDGTEVRIISYHNPVSGKYEFRNADTGELELEVE
jgi:hypothetical protein